LGQISINFSLGRARMSAIKDSPEVVKFLRLFQELKDWCDDEPKGLAEDASKDEGLKKLCLDLLRAAGALQKPERERVQRDLFIGPSDSNFILVFRDFEKRFSHALHTIRSNAVQAGEMDLAFSFDWYEQPSTWLEADFFALLGARAMDDVFELAHERASSEPEIDSTPFNFHAYGGELKELTIKSQKTGKACFEALEEFENILKSHGVTGEAARKILRSQREEWGEDFNPRDIVGNAELVWQHLRNEVEFDLRGVLRRRKLVPFVLFPREVAARQSSDADGLSIHQSLRQAHDAFIFGTPFAALSLMRSVMETVLRDHYGGGHPGDGLTLAQRIRKCRSLLPRDANEAALHRLRKNANAVLHLDCERDELIPKIDLEDLEKEMVSLLTILRALIEGAPKSIAGKPHGAAA
jgi:hypothetical protein